MFPLPCGEKPRDVHNGDRPISSTSTLFTVPVDTSQERIIYKVRLTSKKAGLEASTRVLLM